MRSHRLLIITALLTACVDLNSSYTTNAVPPVITAQPASLTVTAGTPATFTVAATSIDTLVFQWYHNATAIGGATSAKLTLPSASVSDAGSYVVVVSSRTAAVSSDSAVLTVVVPPVLVGYTVSGRVAASTNETFYSATRDESAILVTNGGDLTLVNATVHKTNFATSLANSRANGTGAAILVNGASKATITGGTILGDSTGSTGLFASGAGSSLAAYRVAIRTTSPFADGVAATLGGKVTLDRTRINTGSGTLATATTGSSISMLVESDSIVGNLIADSTSTLTASLTRATTLYGVMTGVALSIDSTSTWSVRGVSTLTSFASPGGIVGSTITTIIGNGYTVFYAKDLPANSALGGRVYTLSGGGTLVPR